ncbi:MAG: FkbM family methyltransferase [Anaerolineae bacterium]|nr:FkbM family methyltransferase [Anaerolineae bacterium]
MLKKLFHNIRYLQFNSSFLRHILGLYYKEGRAYRIPIGSLKNIRLQYDSTINYHAMLGLWEPESFQLLSRIVNYYSAKHFPLVICDVGANIGSYSLWFSMHTQPTSVIYAFEPAADIVVKLKNNLFLNHANNVTVIEKACTDQVGEISFYLGFHHHSSSIDAEWARGSEDKVEEVVVTSTTLDHFFYGDDPEPGPTIIKMDIEGGGTVALKGCEQVIKKERPLFLIESHTPDEDRAISDLLLAHNYQAYRLNTSEWVKQRDTVHPNHDGVWGTMLLCPTDSDIISVIE